VLIDHLRSFAPASEYIAALDEQPVCSEVSRIEIIQGLRTAERTDAETLFSLIEWLPVSEQVARRAGELGRRWRASHPGIGVADLAVAATAEYTSVPLATCNIKHFPMFTDLQAPY
jgi:predicted nucleic acid-binding protein